MTCLDPTHDRSGIQIRDIICFAVLLLACLKMGMAMAAPSDGSAVPSHWEADHASQDDRHALGERVNAEHKGSRPMAQAAITGAVTARPGKAVEGEQAWITAHRRVAIGVTGDLRLFSVLGVRVGIDQGITRSGGRLTVRGGLAVHVLKPTIRPDLYVFADMGLNLALDEQELIVSSREFAGGIGFRMRIGRRGLVGLEAGVVQEGVAATSLHLRRAEWGPEVYRAHFGGQVTLTAGVVF